MLSLLQNKSVHNKLNGVLFILIAKDFFEINGNPIEPTRAEYMIFKYLLSDIGSGNCIHPAQIQRYCYPSNKLNDESADIAVHISHLNRKAEAVALCDNRLGRAAADVKGEKLLVEQIISLRAVQSRRDVSLLM